MPGYNAQAMVSPVETDGAVTGMLVTAADVIDETHDYTQLTSMMQQSEEVAGVTAPMTLADAGYHSGGNLEVCTNRGQRVVMPERTRPLKHPYHKDRFAYDEETDSYV